MGKVHWLFPADTAVDLAAISVDPDQVHADFQEIPFEILATKEMLEERNIAPGDRVVFAGFFYQYAGMYKIQPIVRQGVLAMLPDEPVNGVLNQAPTRLYLADVHAFHGNSGSPLFVNTGGVRGSSIQGDNYLLLGVVSGYYPEDETGFSVPAALSGHVHDNSGISVVVPAEELRALLESSQAKRERDISIAHEGR